MPGPRPHVDPANLIAALVTRDYAASARRGARSAGLYGVAAVLIGTCYAAAVAGLAIFFGQRYGAVAGAFIVAGGALVLAVGLIVVVQAINRADRAQGRPAQPKPPRRHRDHSAGAACGSFAQGDVAFCL